MNAIVSLCHFCADVHGPSILLCTQTFHSDDPQVVVNSESGDIYYMRNRNIKSEKSNEQTCESCESLRDERAGYITSDSDLVYISTRQSEQAAVYSFVRDACVRSLSSEICPGREGPIFFGDNRRGNVLSYSFSLPDVNARGGLKHYSILVLMVDRIYLLNSWVYIVYRLSRIITYLKNKVEERNQSGENGISNKSLAQMIGSDNIYQYLHCEFTSLLRYGGLRLREVLYEGRATEDTMINLQAVPEETFEGFIKLDAIDVKPVAPPSVEENNNHEVKRCQRLRYLAKMLDRQTFRLLIHYLLIGQQIVIRGRNESLVRSVVDCLEKLLPKGCCHTIPFTIEYDEKCNLLGIHHLCKFKDGAIDMCDVILDVDIAFEGKNRYQTVKAALSTYRQLYSPEPSLLNRIDEYIFNETMSGPLLNNCLTSLKTEWINKAKVYFNFTKEILKENLKKKILYILKAGEHDDVMLKFWMTGLSDNFKRHLGKESITTSSSSTSTSTTATSKSSSNDPHSTHNGSTLPGGVSCSSVVMVNTTTSPTTTTTVKTVAK